MRPTERTRNPEPARPAERMFTKRELLLSTWDDRRRMSPADAVGFSYAKTILRMEMNNAHFLDRKQPSFDVAAAMAFADRKAGIPDPEKVPPAAPFVAPDIGLADATPWPRRRRRRPFPHAPG